MTSLKVWRQLRRVVSSRVFLSCPGIRYARDGNQAAVRYIAPLALLEVTDVAFSAAQVHSPPNPWGGARTGTTVPLLGLAAAAASLYACAASMEAENLREEADAQDSCTTSNAPPLESAETVTEKFTEIQFPLHVRMSKKCGDGGQQYHLLGTAVRYLIAASFNRLPLPSE